MPDLFFYIATAQVSEIDAKCRLWLHADAIVWVLVPADIHLVDVLTYIIMTVRIDSP